MSPTDGADAAWRSTLVLREDVLGGEPVFPGTRLAVRHIGALLRRGGLAEVREDHPDRSDRDLAFAARYMVR